MHTLPEAVEAKWYAVQSYSGHEKKVERLVQHKIDEEPGMSAEQKEIQEVLVPVQEVTEIRNGKRVSVTRRLYPGYVLIKMILNDRTQHAVSTINGVIKFVGSQGNPQPLRQDEMNKILGIEVDGAEEREDEIPFHPGQVVEVTSGPFTDFSGTVQEVFADKGKVKVEVSLFGRPTSVELDFTQLQGY